MRISPGGIVVGEDFFGRKKELRKMDELLSNPSNNILIPGPRRIGKSSLIIEFIRINEKKYKILYLDLMRKKSIPDFCQDLLDNLPKKYFLNIFSKEKVKNIYNILPKVFPEIDIKGIKIKFQKIEHDLKSYMRIMDKVFENSYKKGFVFVFDEFSDFLMNLENNNRSEIEQFLRWMRELRQTKKIRLIISGSINIISTAQDLNVTDLLNDLTQIEIFKLTDTEIKELLLKLLQNGKIELTDAASDFAITKLLDGIPYNIQLFADGIVNYLDVNKNKCDEDEIKRIYDRIINKQNISFYHFHDRLKEYLKNEECKSAQKILSNLAFDKMNNDDLWSYVKDILKSKEILDKLLKRLIDEGYIYKENNYYSFVSVMLSDWWKNTYDFERG